MSLSIYLKEKFQKSRDGGRTWEDGEEEVWSKGVTHNLNKMATEAGLYEALWRPYRLMEGYDISETDYNAEYKFEEENKVLAKDIVEVVKKGLDKLRSEPDHFKTFNPENGWGSYESLVKFTTEYLEALKDNPETIVQTCR